ncbi:MAG: hypothetical protein GY782_02720 [Gammaproteobacteria bacterium]|nr:hypothetical protein [Gammaproteobacteria bacterium]
MSKENTSPESGASTDNSQQTKKSSRSLLQRHGFVLILIIAAALLAAASSWLSYRFHHNVGDLADDVKQLSATVTQLQQQVTVQSEQLKTIRSTNGTLQHRLLAKENPGRWQIAEALYFTRLANDSLQFQHDIPTAKQLLTMADKRLLDSGEPAVAALRQQLAEKIAQLSALPQVDIVGLYSKLTALADSIAQLTPLPEIKALQKANSQRATAEKPSAQPGKISWHQGLRDSMKQVWQLIIIQRRDTPIEPLLTNQQYQQLNHSLLLLVRQAQWALLYRQPDIYHSSLQQVATLLKHYYGGNSQQVKPLLATITELDAVKVAVTAPSLAGTIDALSATIANYNQQPAMSRHTVSTSQTQVAPPTASTSKASSL